MIFTPRIYESFARMAIGAALFLAFGTAGRADEETPRAASEPDLDGRPVYVSAGRVVIFPKGVDAPPDDYLGVLGGTPLALIKLEGKVVAEVYAAALNDSPQQEAQGMAASADKNKQITLQKRTSLKHDDKVVEIVTLKLDLDNKLGKPWILHSLYFPQAKASATFKLAVSEKQFKNALPYFEAMFQIDSKED